MKVVVVDVSVSAGDKHRSLCTAALIKLAKVMVPWEFLWEKLTPTPAKNKVKAMKVAVSLRGVQAAGIQGENKDQLKVKGNDEFDPVELVEKLRKRVASATIVSVGPEKKEKEGDGSFIHHYPYYGVPLMKISEGRPFYSLW